MPLTKHALQEMSPLTFNALRLVLASLLLWVLAAILEKGPILQPGTLGRVVLLALIGNTLYQLLFIIGINWTLAGNVALLLSASTIFTALLNRTFGHESFRPIVWAGIGTSLGGVLLILLGSGRLDFSTRTLPGDLLILAGSFCWAVYMVWSKPLMGVYSPLKLTTVTLAAGSLFFFLIALPAVLGENWGNISWLTYAELGYSFLFSLGIGYALWFSAIGRIGSTRTAIYGNLVPFIGLFFAWLILSEPILPAQLAGGVLILLGISLARRGRPLDAPAAVRRRQY